MDKALVNTISNKGVALLNLSNKLMRKAKDCLEASDKKEMTVDTSIEIMKLAITLSRQAHENFSLIKSLED